MRTQVVLLALAAAGQASAFMGPIAPARPARSQVAVQSTAVPAFTTVSGRILPDPNNELEKVLKPSAKDEARRDRLRKVLEGAGLEYQGSAFFPSNRYYKTAMFKDMCDAAGVMREDQLGVAALVVALADKGYKPFHKSTIIFQDVMHSIVKTVLSEVDDFESADLVKVFGALVKLEYGGSPRYLIRDLVRALTARMEGGEVSAKDIATALDASSRYWFVPEDAFFKAAADQSVAKASDFSGQEKAQVKDALSRTLSRLPHLKGEGVVSEAFLKAFA